MYKAIVFLTVLGFLACKDKPAASHAGASKKPANDSSITSVPSQWTKEQEGEFLDNCIANAKARYNNDEKKAFAYCKCVLEGVQQRYPNADSAEAAKGDTAQMAAILQRCK